MFKRLLEVIFCMTVAIGIQAQTTKQPDNPEADRNAILKEIEGITQAFVEGDLDKIYSTHSADWRGFLDYSKKPIIGIDEYMKANGISYPPPAGYQKKPWDPNIPRPFKITNFDVNFYGPEIGVASFMLDFGKPNGADFITRNRLRIMDMFAKRDGKWIQVASHTVVDPTWLAQTSTTPAELRDVTRKQILDAREAVWRAWFANDRQKLLEMLPPETIAIESGGKDWQNREAILAAAEKFAAGGAKLTRLEFPRTEIQAYGNTVILFTSYLFETEKNGKKRTSSGSGIETFVRRNGKYLNTGWLITVSN